MVGHNVFWGHGVGRSFCIGYNGMRLLHLSEMLAGSGVSSTTLRLTACVVLIALRALHLSEMLV